jgi:hypothetical protein
MVSVVAAFREGRRVTKAPRNTEDTLVEDGEFDRSEPGRASRRAAVSGSTGERGHAGASGARSST